MDAAATEEMNRLYMEMLMSQPKDAEGLRLKYLAIISYGITTAVQALANIQEQLHKLE